MENTNTVETITPMESVPEQPEMTDQNNNPEQMNEVNQVNSPEQADKPKQPDKKRRILYIVVAVIVLAAAVFGGIKLHEKSLRDRVYDAAQEVLDAFFTNYMEENNLADSFDNVLDSGAHVWIPEKSPIQRENSFYTLYCNNGTAYFDIFTVESVLNHDLNDVRRHFDAVIKYDPKTGTAMIDSIKWVGDWSVN